MKPLLLASASPRRRELLENLGFSLVVTAVDADETTVPGELPEHYLDRIVREKLRLAQRYVESAPVKVAAVLVADTIVIADGGVLGKPTSDENNRGMLALLSGRTHEVATRFAIADSSGAEALSVLQTVRTTVTFRALLADEIDAYVATGEGQDKAGGYAIQGIGAFAVERINGSYSNVVGLPTCEVVSALRTIGYLTRFPFR